MLYLFALHLPLCSDFAMLCRVCRRFTFLCYSSIQQQIPNLRGQVIKERMFDLGPILQYKLCGFCIAAVDQRINFWEHAYLLRNQFRILLGIVGQLYQIDQFHGTIDAAITQSPEGQGHRAIMVLFPYITSHTVQPEVVLFDSHIKLKESID